MTYARASLTICVAVCAACDPTERSLGSAGADTASVIRAVLEYRLSREDSITLERRLLPADTLGFLPPFSQPHALLPPSSLLAEVAADLADVTLAPMRRTEADSGWVMSISRPIILGDSVVVYWADSFFEPSNSTGYGYWAAFLRADLVRSGDRWRIVRVASVGTEN